MSKMSHVAAVVMRALRTAKGQYTRQQGHPWRAYGRGRLSAKPSARGRWSGFGSGLAARLWLGAGGRALARGRG